MRHFDEYNQEELLPLISDEFAEKDAAKTLSLSAYVANLRKQEFTVDANPVVRWACAGVLLLLLVLFYGSSKTSDRAVAVLPHAAESQSAFSVARSAPVATTLETFVSNWKKVSSDLWSTPRKQVEGNVAASGELVWNDDDRLWSMFGQSRGQTGVRNRAMVEMLSHIKPQRVFEWAGYGGFFVQQVMLDFRVRSTVQHWVHAEYALGALDYAVFLLSNDTQLANPSLDADVARMALPRSWHASLPFVRYMPPTNPTLALEVVELDVENISQVTRTSDLWQFDAFVTITFGHFVADFELIRLMRPGSFFVFCVANFGARKGVRHFHSVAEIRDRYRDYLEIIESQEVTDPSNPGSFKRKYVVSSRVKQTDAFRS